MLPFVNLSGDASIDAWCDALTDEMIDALVQLPRLKVVARTTSFSFKGRHVDVREIAREVGVRTLLEGSVQSRSGGRRVVAQLIDGATGIHLWSHAFEADAQDEIHRVVHALARAVVRGLSLQAGTVLLSRAAQRMSDDADARDSYQRGRYLLGRHTRDAYKDAASLFDRALARDPAFALAWAAKAKACIGLYGLAVTPDPDTVDSARTAVARALELDPELGDAHAAAATLAFAHDRDFARAERAALEAIRYAPGHAYVHHNYAWTLMFAGRFGEAEQEFAIAREFDPLDPMLRVHQALVAFYRRDFEEAVEALRRVLEMEPQNLVARVLSASAHLGRGDYDDALALFERIAADVPADSIGPLGVVQAHALAGRMERSARRIRRDARALRRGARRSLPDGDGFQPARRRGFCVRVARARRGGTRPEPRVPGRRSVVRRVARRCAVAARAAALWLAGHRPARRQSLTCRDSPPSLHGRSRSIGSRFLSTWPAPRAGSARWR